MYCVLPSSSSRIVLFVVGNCPHEKKKNPWYEASKRFVAQLAAVPVVGGRFGGACERGWNASNKRLVLRLIKGCLRPLLCDEE